MVALPDYAREFTQKPISFQDGVEFPDRDDSPSVVLLALRVLVGTALVAASLGLWIMPSGLGDPGMMLMKLLISLAFFWTGVLCFVPRPVRDDRPRIELDARARTLRVIYSDRAGGKGRVIEHDIDAMAELSLRDGLLTARDGDGRQIVALKVQNARTERMLQSALSLAV